MSTFMKFQCMLETCFLLFFYYTVKFKNVITVYL